MIDVQLVLDLQKLKVEEWHNELVLTEELLPFKFIEENHSWNFLLWHEEDIARIKDIDAERIMEAKRNIDGYNQARNNAMEKIDEWILNYLDFNKKKSSGVLHSETPGMMIDRLSIMALKRFHMNEEVERKDASNEHKEKCKSKVELLDEQISDLSNCLDSIFSKLENGEIRFKVYRQLKMYNDPSLNPELYKRQQ
jgi:predicted  nucleic acid-binding Zn-ribbon protein